MYPSDQHFERPREGRPQEVSAVLWFQILLVRNVCSQSNKQSLFESLRTQWSTQCMKS